MIHFFIHLSKEIVCLPWKFYILFNNKNKKKIKQINSPIIEAHFSLIIPLGNKWKSNSVPCTTTVCPALFPPLKRKDYQNKYVIVQKELIQAPSKRTSSILFKVNTIDNDMEQKKNKSFFTVIINIEYIDSMYLAVVASILL